jgi:F420-non-reducing hydrogenase iron-sulfur subunit
MEGNYKTMRRMAFLKKLVSDLGLEPDRLALEWVSAGEGGRFREVINEFVERIIELGPNPLGKKTEAKPGETEAAVAKQ